MTSKTQHAWNEHMLGVKRTSLEEANIQIFNQSKVIIRLRTEVESLKEQLKNKPEIKSGSYPERSSSAFR